MAEGRSTSKGRGFVMDTPSYMEPSADLLMTDAPREFETLGPRLAMLVFGWDSPMWRYRNPWGGWQEGPPPSLEHLFSWMAGGS